MSDMTGALSLVNSKYSKGKVVNTLAQSLRNVCLEMVLLLAKHQHPQWTHLCMRLVEQDSDMVEPPWVLQKLLTRNSNHNDWTDEGWYNLHCSMIPSHLPWSLSIEHFCSSSLKYFETYPPSIQSWRAINQLIMKYLLYKKPELITLGDLNGIINKDWNNLPIIQLRLSTVLRRIFQGYHILRAFLMQIDRNGDNIHHSAWVWRFEDCLQIISNTFDSHRWLMPLWLFRSHLILVHLSIVRLLGVGSSPITRVLSKLNNNSGCLIRFASVSNSRVLNNTPLSSRSNKVNGFGWTWQRMSNLHLTIDHTPSHYLIPFLSSHMSFLWVKFLRVWQ